MEKTIKETTRLLLNGTLTKEDADKILLDLYNVIGRSELLIALQNIEKVCDNQNPTHEEIWRIAYGAINSQ